MLKEPSSPAQKPSKPEEQASLPILNAQRTSLPIRNTAGLASAPKQRRKDGTLLVADHQESIHISNFIILTYRYLF